MAGTDESRERLREWEEAIGGRPEFRVEISRIEPKVWEGRRIDGKLGTVDDLPDVEDLQADYGGGTFSLKVKRPDGKGRYVYAVTRTVKIAGPPKIPFDAELAFDNGAERDRIVQEIAERVAQRLFGERVRKIEIALEALGDIES
jgi:hypothetical protein